MANDKKAIFWIFGLLYTITSLALYVLIVDLDGRAQNAEDRLDYLTSKMYDLAAKEAVDARDLRLLKTDVEIHERIIVRGEYIDIDEGAIHD